VVVVGMSVQAVGVILQSGENHRATGRAGCRGSKSLRETRALGGELIKVWRLYDRRSVTASDRALIVGHEEHDVRFLLLRVCNAAK